MIFIKVNTITTEVYKTGYLFFISEKPNSTSN